ALPRRPAALPDVRGPGRAHRDHPARAAGPGRPGPGLPAVAALPAGVHLRPATPAAALRQLAGHGAPRPAGGPAATAGVAARRLPGVPGPDLAGEAPGP